MTNRGTGWADMERRYRRNRVPVAPVVTGWEELITASGFTEKEALAIIAANPLAKEAKKLKKGMVEGNSYRHRFYPPIVLAAFGLDTELEARVDGEWANARSPKPKSKKRKRTKKATTQQAVAA